MNGSMWFWVLWALYLHKILLFWQKERNLSWRFVLLASFMMPPQLLYPLVVSDLSICILEEIRLDHIVSFIARPRRVAFWLHHIDSWRWQKCCNELNNLAHCNMFRFTKQGHQCHLILVFQLVFFNRKRNAIGRKPIGLLTVVFTVFIRLGTHRLSHNFSELGN